MFPTLHIKWLLLLTTLVITVQASAVWQGTPTEAETPILDVDVVPEVNEIVAAPVVSTTTPEQIPDFANYTDVRAKKQAFFDFMLPLIRHANEKILSERNEIETIRNSLLSGETMDGEDRQRLKELFSQYRLRAPAKLQARDLQDLLERIDVVPASLVLAQSANESGWGTSRFAIEANNFFGIWCFSKGCGIVPLSRSKGLKHEVASYQTVQKGVVAYLRNINTHNAYRKLRSIRSQQRELNDRLHGQQLAEGLLAYSERGIDYVREIQAMIRVNRLEQFNLPFNA